MENAFLTTAGSLADGLMAVLQAAKVPGADTRCLDEGKSSISAFVRVAKPGDPEGDCYLDLNVPNTPVDVDPIDVLQGLFDEWRLQQTGAEQARGVGSTGGILYPRGPDPVRSHATIRYALAREMGVRLGIFDLAGREVERLSEGAHPEAVHEIRWSPEESLASGIYFARLEGTGRARGQRPLLQRLLLLR